MRGLPTMGNFTELSVKECGREKCTGIKDICPDPLPYHRIHYIIGGKGTFKIADRETVLSRGDLFYIPPQAQDIRYFADKTDPWEYCWVGFEGTNARTYLDAMGFKNEWVVSDKARVLKNDFIDLADSYYQTGELDLMCLSSLLKIVYRAVNLNQNSEQISVKESHILQAREFIACNYQFNITVTDIAGSLGLTPNYLANIFHEILGESPKQYLIRYRIQKACALLSCEKCKVKEVGEKVGYKNQLHFSAEFKRLKNLSPVNYVKANKQAMAKREG